MAEERWRPAASDGPHADDGEGLASAARNSGEKLKAQAQDRAEAGKDRAADGLGHATEAVRTAAEQLRDQEPWMADLLSRGADELTNLAEAVRTNDLRNLLSRAEDLSRRQPMLAAGAAFAAGFAAMRATRLGMASAGGSMPESTGNAMATARREASDAIGAVSKGNKDAPEAERMGAQNELGRTDLEH